MFVALNLDCDVVWCIFVSRGLCLQSSDVRITVISIIHSARTNAIKNYLRTQFCIVSSVLNLSQLGGKLHLEVRTAEVKEMIN